MPDLSPAPLQPVIDLSIPAELLGHDQAKVQKFAIRFVQSTRTGLDEMDAALAAGDVQRMRELGHRIKSAARVMGALGLAHLCEQLEHLPPQGADAERAAARALSARLSLLFDQITEHLMQNTTFTVDN